jgi:hypothetical protein
MNVRFLHAISKCSFWLAVILGVFGSLLQIWGLHLAVQAPAGQARSMQGGRVWLTAPAEPSCREPAIGCQHVHADAKKECSYWCLVAWIKTSALTTCMKWRGELQLHSLVRRGCRQPVRNRMLVSLRGGWIRQSKTLTYGFTTFAQR